MGPCDGVGWFFTEWTNECSERCGSGIQTRSVVCAGLEEKYRRKFGTTSNEILETNEIEQDDDPDAGRTESLERSVKHSEYQNDQSLCDPRTKPEEERQCFSDQHCIEPVWFTSPWSEVQILTSNSELF